jgi:GNAT superfamily N-acetyltransferase
MSGGDPVTLVPFERTHLDGAHRLSQEMSWMHRREDWELALDVGKGFVLEDAGQVIGTAMWWPYGDTHASMGMIIVAKAAQGRRYGARLMDALLAAAEGRIVTLNATQEGLELYKRRGFTPIGVIHQHQGIPTREFKAPPASVVRSMVAADVEAVARLDREATGWTRSQMLPRLAQAGDGYVLDRDGTARGYAFCRLFGRGHVIGPVVADSLDDARALIEAALARLGPTFVRVDTSTATRLGPWLEEIGLKQAGDNTTMVLGPHTPPTGPARMFALAAQSFN